MALQGTAATGNSVIQRHVIYLTQTTDNLATYNDHLRTLQVYADDEASQQRAIAKVALEDILQDTLAMADQSARALEKAIRALDWIRASGARPGQPSQVQQPGQVRRGKGSGQPGQRGQPGQPREPQFQPLEADLLGMFDPMATPAIASGPSSQGSSSFSGPAGQVFFNRTCELGAFNPVIHTCIHIHMRSCAQ